MTTDPAARIRIHHPDRIDDPPETSTAPTLSEAYRELLFPDLRRSAAGTRGSYKTTLRYWKRYTKNPPVDLIDEATWRRFRDRVKRGRSWATVGRFRRNIRAILNRCVEKALIYDLPKMRGVEPTHGTRRYIPPEVMGRWFDACRVAVWPSRGQLPAPLWWRAALLLDWTMGLRSDSELHGFTWQHILFQEACPLRELAGVQHPHGWLMFTPPKTARRKPALVLPLSRNVRAILELIRASSRAHGSRKPVLFKPRNPETFKWQKEEIQRAAGIESPYYQFQELRKTCGILYDQVQFGLGDHVLGHAPRGVHDRYYRAALLHLAAACDQIEQPEAFTRFLQAEGVLTTDSTPEQLEEPRQPPPLQTNLTASHPPEEASHPPEDRQPPGPKPQSLQPPAAAPIRRSDWTFTPGRVDYRGRSFRLPARLHKLLRAFVASGRPLAVEDLRSTLAVRGEAKITDAVERLADRLVKDLALPDGWEPFPFDWSGGCWSLTLPANEGRVE